jgi:hypothetical protein
LPINKPLQSENNKNKVDVKHENIKNNNEKQKITRENLQSLSVEELRRLARKTENITIYGREISKANKNTLITEIMKAYEKTNK